MSQPAGQFFDCTLNVQHAEKTKFGHSFTSHSHQSLKRSRLCGLTRKIKQHRKSISNNDIQQAEQWLSYENVSDINIIEITS